MNRPISSRLFGMVMLLMIMKRQLQQVVEQTLAKETAGNQRALTAQDLTWKGPTNIIACR